MQVHAYDLQHTRGAIEIGEPALDSNAPVVLPKIAHAMSVQDTTEHLIHRTNFSTTCMISRRSAA
eukprot:5675097-Lingulodinium_polyedra.AAC.1